MITKILIDKFPVYFFFSTEKHNAMYQRHESGERARKCEWSMGETGDDSLFASHLDDRLLRCKHNTLVQNTKVPPPYFLLEQRNHVAVDQDAELVVARKQTQAAVREVGRRAKHRVTILQHHVGVHLDVPPPLPRLAHDPHEYALPDERVGDAQLPQRRA